MNNLGLVSVSFRNNCINEILRAVNNAKLSLVEWGSDIHAPCNDTQRLLQIAALQKQYGIECCSYGTYFKIGKDKPDDIWSYIIAAKILGTDILRIWCGNKNFEDYTADELDVLVSNCKKVAKTAEKENVTLCLECHNGTITNCLEGAKFILDAVNSEHFKMYWQPNQYKSFETNLEYAKNIAKQVKVIHVFNWTEKENLPLLLGVDIWKKYLENFDSNIPLLLEFMPDGKIESLNAESDALRLIVKE